MEVEELRIGNLVTTVEGTKHFEKELEVEFLTNNNCYDLDAPLDSINGYELNKVIPILITEEWLVRFGFKRLDKGDVSAQFYIGENPLTHDWLFDLKWIKDYEKIPPYPLKGFPFYRNGLFEVKHVHQLQNLYFALTGEELVLTDK